MSLMVFAPTEQAARIMARRLTSQPIARIEPLALIASQENLKTWWREIKTLTARRPSECARRHNS